MNEDSNKEEQKEVDYEELVNSIDDDFWWFHSLNQLINGKW